MPTRWTHAAAVMAALSLAMAPPVARAAGSTDGGAQAPAGSPRADRRTPPGKPGKPAALPKLDLSVPLTGTLPSVDGLRAKDAAPSTPQPPAREPEATCKVLSVVHGRGTQRAGKGLRLKVVAQSVVAAGQPPLVDPFSSVVRFACPSISLRTVTLVATDSAGEKVMSARERLRFDGAAETDWAVDWDATRLRRVSDLAFTVQVDEATHGPYPLKVEAKP